MATYVEHEDRLEMMVADEGQTWDLSHNDKEAIRWALAEIKTLRRRIIEDGIHESETDRIIDEMDSPGGDGYVDR